MSFPTLYFTGTSTRAKAAAEAYNEKFSYINEKGKKRYRLSCCIRKQHLQLFEILVRKLGQKLYKHDWTTNGLPTIHCKRNELAKQALCDPKTVYNLLQRLGEAGFIEKKFKGTEFAFEISFNSEILSKRERLNGAELDAKITKFDAEEVENALHNTLQTLAGTEQSEAVASGDKMKTLPHTIQTFNQLLNGITSNVDSVENLGKTPGKVVLQLTGASSSTESSVENLETRPVNKNGETSGRETVPGKAPRSAAPPETLLVSHTEAMEVAEMVRDIWGYCFSKLYKKYEYLSPSQIIHAQLYFAEGLLKLGDPEKRRQKKEEIILRLNKATHWVNRQPGRFIPLPSIYFKKDNPKGFINTRNWLINEKTDEASLQQIADDYNRQLNLYRSYEKAADSVDLHSWGTFKKALKKMENTGSSTAYNALYEFIEKQYQNQVYE